jgi:hypothetical protein
VTTFGDVRGDMAGKLTAGGVAAVTLNPASEPPFVLVDLVTLRLPTQGIGAWPGAVAVRIVHPPPGDAAAAGWLETQLESVLVALGGAEAVPTTHRIGATDVACPAYVVLYPVTVPNPTC